MRSYSEKTVRAILVVYFSTSNLCFKVYVDDEPVYSYETKENLTGTGDGISYHMIGLGSRDLCCGFSC